MFLRKGLTGVMDYVSENHSKYLLMVHLIFVVKYRRNLLIKFGDEIKQIFYDIANEKDIVIVEMEVDKNHIRPRKGFVLSSSSPCLFFDKGLLMYFEKYAEILVIGVQKLINLSAADEHDLYANWNWPRLQRRHRQHAVLLAQILNL